MKNILFTAIIALTIGVVGCNDTDRGYLHYHNAQYNPDSVVFKAVLDPNIPADARKIEFEIPWQSGVIQGVQGTSIITYSIADIKAPNITEEIKNQFYMEGVGVVHLPFNHTVPVGSYLIDVKIENMRETVVLTEALKIIIE